MSPFRILSAWIVSVFVRLCVYCRRLVLRILAVGPIPKHIAIIMDGNRRFADRARIERSRGHLFGYERLIDTLENCLELGVKYVSVYAFSIDNFGRPQDEVSCLMSLMEDKLNSLVTEDRLFKDLGVRVQVVGDRTLLPVNVREAADRAMAATKENTAAVLNLCVAYTSTAEIVHSIQEIRDGILLTAGRERVPSAAVQGGVTSRDYTKVHEHESDDSQCNELPSNHASSDAPPPILVESSGGFEIDQDVDLPGLHRNWKARREPRCRSASDCRCANGSITSSGASDTYEGLDKRKKAVAFSELITECEIENHLYTAGCPPPDLLIRTSGETRLSNFMLWQCSLYSRLAFCNVLWPQFNLRHLVWIMLDYQRSYPALQSYQKAH